MSEHFNSNTLVENVHTDAGSGRRTAGESTKIAVGPGSEAAGRFASGVIARYSNAYLVARALRGLGTLVKLAGAAIGFLLLLGPVWFAASYYNARELPVTIVLAGMLLGAAAWFLVYCLGVLITAQGELLLSAVDAALNGSPFLTDHQRAATMSLRVAGVG